MVIGYDDDDYYDYDNDVKNTVRIETLEDIVPPCLRNLNPSNSIDTITPPIASVLGKVSFFIIGVIMIKVQVFFRWGASLMCNDCRL